MAAAKKLTPEQAKAARQKKIAIGGAVLLVAILAFEIPKTMKMLGSKTPPASAAPATTTTPTTPATGTPAAPTGAATPAAASTGSTSAVDNLVVTADLSPAPLEGQLPALDATFTSKDPFVQQLGGSSSSTSSSSSDGTDTTSSGSSAKKPKTPNAGSTQPSSGTTTTPTAPASPGAPPTSATISVNGVDSSVTLDGDFPTDNPLFHLVALTSKTAKISIAGGGSLSSGAPTITLRLGVSLTLMNTADGTRYKLVLVSTSAGSSSSSTTTTTPTTTTPAG
jgi:hypothetical protein